jgi:GNAT superfamily N-acetyltransferase
MGNLSESRQAIRRLLDERLPADAIASYYAFYHPDHKTQLVTYPAGTGQVTGYVALSRTGMDLFRPLVTMRLPIADLEASADLIYQALLPGSAVIISCPPIYQPLLEAFFEVQDVEPFQLLILDRLRFEPIINVLVTQAESPNNLPRFVIRRTGSPDQEVAASAGLNWQSRYFAEISVHTNPGHQRQGWGRSVVAAMVQYLLGNGRTPLYVVSENNAPSIQLAQSVGFIDSGVRLIILQGVLKPRP